MRPRQRSPRAGFDAVFLDQRGARFGEDLRVLEESGLLNPGAIVVADNVLKPGAPAPLIVSLSGGGAANGREIWAVSRGSRSRRISLLGVPAYT